METIPPGDASVTIPPPPRRIVRVATALGAAAVLLLAAAIVWQRHFQMESTGNYDAGAAFRTTLGRILWGLSALSAVAGVVAATSAWQRARGSASVALALGGAWLAGLLWYLFG